MNKQELIDELARHASCLEDFRGIIGHCDGKYEAYEIAIELAKQLDEPQKPVVPQFVAEWFEEHKRDLNYSIWKYIRDWEKQDETSDFYQWFDAFDKSIETLFRMKDGYEVEKKPLYEVIIGNLFLVKKFNNRNDYCFLNKFELHWWEKSAYQLTEPEIKAIDERYWAFAVPVEEVAEG
ncbi:DUF1642 domain-containing protein [Enterococcus hirae]